MILCLICALLAFGVDGISRIEFVEKISRVSFSEAPPGSLPLIPGTREENLVLPYASMDARWWVLHTENMLRYGTWRIRATALDNAPLGREVHWSSLLIWTLGGMAWLQSLGSGKPAGEFVAEAAMAAGPVMLVACLIGLCTLVARRNGIFSSLFFAMVVLTSYPIVRNFLTGEADHHGMVVCFAMASVFCLLAGGCGLARRPGRPKCDRDDEEILELRTAKRWFVCGGIFGAAALWISAATALPILAAAGFGGWLSSLWITRGQQARQLCPEVWTAWGLSGCLSSLGFYLLEYFPGHMGWRLEVNHPLYAAAWLGGGVFISRSVAGALRKRFSGKDIAMCFLALAAAVAPVFVIMLFRQTFWVSDRFLLALHKEFILEFQSIGTISRLAGGGLSWLSFYPWPFACLVATGALIATRSLGPATVRGLILLAPAIFVTQALTVFQVRWGSAAFAMWSLCALVLMLDVAMQQPASRVQSWTFRGLLFIGWLAIGITVLPQTAIRAEEERTCLDAPIRNEIAGNLLLRDISHRLIQSGGSQVPVVLTGPNASTEMAYHAGVRTVGTLYWENMPGLKRAAKIFAVSDEAEAFQALQEAGVTHIVVPSWDNFGESYAKLLADAEGRTTTQAPFFKAIVEGDQCPQWLRPFAYPIPTNSGLDSKSVKILAFLPEQSPFESAFFQGIYFYETAQLEKARPQFVRAHDLRPSDPRPESYLAAIDAQIPR